MNYKIVTCTMILLLVSAGLLGCILKQEDILDAHIINLEQKIVSIESNLMGIQNS